MKTLFGFLAIFTGSMLASPVQAQDFELLAVRGDVIFFDRVTRYTCSKLGSNYVLVGMKVRFKPTVLHGIDLYCAPMRSNGTMGAAIFLPATASAEGSGMEAKCAAGSAVVGYKAYRDTSNDSPAHLRSLVLYCKPVNASGQATGSTATLSPLGVQSGTAMAAELCTGLRAAREVRLAVAQIVMHPTTIGAWQLGCARPTLP